MVVTAWADFHWFIPSVCFEELDAGDRGSACAVHHHLDVAERTVGEVQRVDETGGRDDCGTVLVIVEDWNVQQFAQALFDDEAFWSLDILEVDATKAGVEVAYAIDESVDVLGVDLEVEAIDAGEALEEHRLALHHRLGGERAEITEAENCRAVRDHRHHVALGGEIIGESGIALDMQTGKSDTRRIG